MTHLHPDRLFPASEPAKSIARELYPEVAELPLICPHGHTDPSWFAQNTRFSDPAALFLTPDHYVLRMLRSRGLSYDDLGVPRKDGKPVAQGRDAWRLFAANYHLFAGTPSKTWIDHALNWGFGITEELSATTADAIYDTIDAALATPELLPHALLDRARVEVIATTEFALDPLPHHQEMEANGTIGRVRTTYRPDDVTDPGRANIAENLQKFGEITGENVTNWAGLINAHRNRREYFRRFGAVATDHGVPTANTADLSAPEKQALLDKVLSGLFAIVQQLYGISRSSVGDTRINVGTLHAGTAHNVIADCACMEIEVRGKNDEVCAYMETQARRIIRCSAEMLGVSTEIKTMGSCDALESDLALMELVATACGKLQGVSVHPPLRREVGGSEDFSCMMRCVREHGGQATMLRFLTDITGVVHGNGFDFDDADILPKAVAVMSAVIYDIHRDHQRP